MTSTPVSTTMTSTPVSVTYTIKRDHEHPGDGWFFGDFFEIDTAVSIPLSVTQWRPNLGV